MKVSSLAPELALSITIHLLLFPEESSKQTGDLLKFGNALALHRAGEKFKQFHHILCSTMDLCQVKKEYLYLETPVEEPPTYEL